MRVGVEPTYVGLQPTASPLGHRIVGGVSRVSRPGRSRTGHPGFGGPAENPSLEQYHQRDSNPHPPG